MSSLRNLLSWSLAMVLPSLAAAASAPVAPPVSLEGSWATKVVLPVKWRMNLALEGGSGDITVLALIKRTATEAAGELSFDESMLVCALEQPPTKTLSLYGGERFAVAYQPQGLGRPIAGHSALEGAPAQLASAPVVVQAGIDMPAPLTTPWPRAAAQLAPLLTQHDASGVPGAPAASRNDGEFVWPPVDYSASRRAHTFFIATRVPFRTVIDVPAAGGDVLTGIAQLVNVAGRSGLGTAIVGCHTDDGGQCSPGGLSLTNSFQPSMRHNGDGSVRMVRLGQDATCDDVRAHFAP